MRPSVANLIKTINHPEALIGGSGNLREIMGLASNQNFAIRGDGTFAIQTFGEDVEVSNGTHGEYRVRHYGNTQSDINSAFAVLDAYTNTLSTSKWANNAANAGSVNAIDNAFATGKIYSVDGVNGGRFYTGGSETGNVFIGTQNSQNGFASGLEIAGLIAHEGTHVYQYARGLDPRVQLSEYAAHAAQYAVMKGMSSYTLTAQEMQSINSGYNFAEANDYAASNPAGTVADPIAAMEGVFGSGTNSEVSNDYCSDVRTLKEMTGWNFGDGSAAANKGAVDRVKAYLQSIGVQLTDAQINKIAENAVYMAQNAVVSDYSNNYNSLDAQAKIYQNFCNWAAGAYLVNIGAIDAQTGAIAPGYANNTSSGRNTTQPQTLSNINPNPSNNIFTTSEVPQNLNQQNSNEQNRAVSTQNNQNNYGTLPNLADGGNAVERNVVDDKAATASSISNDDIRREEAREFFLRVESERLLAEYDNLLAKSGQNLDNKNALIKNDPKTNAIVSKLMEIVNLPVGKSTVVWDDPSDNGNEIAYNGYYEAAMAERERLVKTLFETRPTTGGRDANFNMENLEQARIHISGSHHDFEDQRRGNIDSLKYNGKRVEIDGEMLFSTGREFVDEINRFISLGGKMQTLVINAHGLGTTIINSGTPQNPGPDFFNGVYYNTYHYDLTVPAAQPGPLAANLNEINRAEGVADNFTFLVGACKGAGFAKAGLEMAVFQNPELTGGTAWGRNYDGNILGHTHLQQAIWDGNRYNNLQTLINRWVFIGTLKTATEVSRKLHFPILAPDICSIRIIKEYMTQIVSEILAELQRCLI